MKDLKKRIKSHLISKAQSLGSVAKTPKKALHYILINSVRTPLEKRGERARPWNRDKLAKENYIASRKEEKDERYLNSRGRLSPRQIKKRNQKRDLNITNLAKDALLNDWPYRKSESGWAGGDHIIRVSIAKTPSAHGESQKVWSRNGKWSGNDSYAYINATRRTFKHFPTLTTPDGLVVVDAKKIGNREYKIIWVEQSRGFDLKTASGWLIKGFHVKGGTLEQARKKTESARKKALAAEMAKRQQYKDFSTVWVSFKDSLAAGNCETASREVERQLFRKYGKIGGIRADELLIFRDDVYTRRTVAAAQARVNNN